MKITNSSEGELRWFDLSNLPNKQVIPSDYKMITQIALKPPKHTSFYNIKVTKDGNSFTLNYFHKLH